MKRILIPPLFVLVFVLTNIALFIYAEEYNYISFPYNLSGLLVIYFAMTIMGKSRDLFIKHETSVAYEKSNKLVTEGIYSKSRNPMYLGMMLLLLGLAICLQNVFGLMFPFLFYFVTDLYYIPFEEKVLTEQFDIEYLEYKSKVKRWYLL